MKKKLQAKVKATATETIKVPASIKAAVTSIIQAKEGVLSALGNERKVWLNTGQALAKITTDKEKAREMLKQALTDSGKFDMKHISTRSMITKILSLGFVPEARQEDFQKAVQEDLPTGKLLSVSSGTLKRTKKGDWLPVQKAPGGAGREQKKKANPAETFNAGWALLITAASTAKVRVEAIANAIVEHCKDSIYTPKAILIALEAAVEKD